MTVTSCPNPACTHPYGVHAKALVQLRRTESGVAVTCRSAVICLHPDCEGCVLFTPPEVAT